MRFYLLLLCVSFAGILRAQDYFPEKRLNYENSTYIPDIRSVKLISPGNPLSYALIGLGSNEKLELSFDDLSGEIKDYTYTFEHCNAEWESSELPFLDFCDGIDNVFITDYEFSGNTLKKYVSYKAVFPNDQVQFRLSGNYLLKVFENGDPESPVLTQRFMIYERRVFIKPDVHRPMLAEYRRTHQEIDFSILSPAYELTNPYSDMKVNIMQNGRWDNMIEGLPPLFVKDREIEFNYEIENLFEGSNEFRMLDMRNSSLSGAGVDKVFSRNDTNFVFLQTDISRGIRVYQDQPDINGAWAMEVNDMSYNSDRDAEYAQVFFSLKSQEKLIGQRVYVMAEFTGRKINPDYEMIYDAQLGVYKMQTTLKQGLYNYIYVTVKDDEKAGSSMYFEGSHAQTENNYSILIYHKTIQDRHVRLIAADHFQINF